MHYVLPPDKIHTHWDQDLPPALTVASGSRVSFILPEVTGGIISPQSDARDLLTLTEDYALGGPIAIAGAKPGDALEIRIL